MSENYPFDREHCLVSINFPAEFLSNKDEIYSRVNLLASKRGGVDAGQSEPTPELLEREPKSTFGISIAFEAGDVNIEGFINWTKASMNEFNVSIEYDPEMIFGPDMEDKSFRR